MYGLFECMSSGCVAQKGVPAKKSYDVIQGWDRALAGHLKLSHTSSCGLALACYCYTSSISVFMGCGQRVWPAQ